MVSGRLPGTPKDESLGLQEAAMLYFVQVTEAALPVQPVLTIYVNVTIAAEAPVEVLAAEDVMNRNDYASPEKQVVAVLIFNRYYNHKKRY
ncbi:hypothetical protein LS482_12000 [Sinomicrobium kalidii]|uniref:hypothetical protein n=1 Tax=Sinomicrobium kalidii TaxID=2900738 RepID=UPI001E3D5985|nr:hypothetical protein [Sinomicrobium kalidii]UGU14428.1 hypothetical protein LS482_12000 [Sinomicrobium kalidii]